MVIFFTVQVVLSFFFPLWDIAETLERQKAALVKVAWLGYGNGDDSNYGLLGTCMTQPSGWRFNGLFLGHFAARAHMGRGRGRSSVGEASAAYSCPDGQHLCHIIAMTSSVRSTAHWTGLSLPVGPADGEFLMCASLLRPCCALPTCLHHHVLRTCHRRLCGGSTSRRYRSERHIDFH